MRRSFRYLGWFFLVAAVTTAALSALVLDRQPLIADDIAATATERAWAKHWLISHRPGSRRSGDLVSFDLSARQATLVANELLDRFGQGHAVVRLEENRALIKASLALPWDLFASYVNVELTFVEDGHLPKVESARLAGLPLPDALVQSLADRALGAVERTQLFRKVDVTTDHLAVTYESQPNILEAIGGEMVASADRPTLLRYQASLASWLKEQPRRTRLELAGPLSHLLAEAAAQPPQADPIAENRAAIMVLAAYVNGRVIRDPAAKSAPPRVRPLFLRGRRDLSQHFMSSAVLAIQGNDTLSHLVGWYKELSDSQGGSGFSFVDMTANRSGIRFAALATGSVEGARQVQRLAARGLTEADFMPAVTGLPEGMNREEFSLGFGEPGHLVYQRMIAHIDSRIDASPLYRKPPG